ncbi:unnamed protein product [Rhodiola kirilowii]
MKTELVEVFPAEINFALELNSQCYCTVKLMNVTNDYVAYKVKTTSPKTYSVRPNVGVILPKSSCEFIVTMQAQKTAPPDLICKDKFLIQSTIVPVGTTNGAVKPKMFAKNDGRYIEERKLKVILTCLPSYPPILTPLNGQMEHGATDEAALVDNTGVANNIDSLTNHDKGAEGFKSPGIINSEVLKKATERETETEDENGSKLVEDALKTESKVNDLETKINKAELTISKLVDKKGFVLREEEALRHELELLKHKNSVINVSDGFSLSFVLMVAIISITIGYYVQF